MNIEEKSDLWIIKFMNSRKQVEAFHKHDLRIILQRLDLLEDFDLQKIKCQFCHDVICEGNFGAIYSQNQKISFSCSKLECLAKLP